MLPKGKKLTPRVKHTGQEFTKVHFELEQDERGYPPVACESLWCVRQGRRYIVANSPLFVEGLSWGDEIAVKKRKKAYLFDRIVRRSRNSNILFSLKDQTFGESLRSGLDRFSCRSEGVTFRNGLVFGAICVPASAAYPEVLKFLENGERRGEWEFHESSFRHKGRRSRKK